MPLQVALRQEMLITTQLQSLMLPLWLRRQPPVESSAKTPGHYVSSQRFRNPKADINSKRGMSTSHICLLDDVHRWRGQGWCYNSQQGGTKSLKKCSVHLEMFHPFLSLFGASEAAVFLGRPVNISVCLCCNQKTANSN